MAPASVLKKPAGAPLPPFRHEIMQEGTTCGTCMGSTSYQELCPWPLTPQSSELWKLKFLKATLCSPDQTYHSPASGSVMLPHGTSSEWFPPHAWARQPQLRNSVLRTHSPVGTETVTLQPEPQTQSPHPFLSLSLTPRNNWDSQVRLYKENQDPLGDIPSCLKRVKSFGN